MRQDRGHALERDARPACRTPLVGRVLPRHRQPGRHRRLLALLHGTGSARAIGAPVDRCCPMRSPGWRRVRWRARSPTCRCTTGPTRCPSRPSRQHSLPMCGSRPLAATLHPNGWPGSRNGVADGHAPPVWINLEYMSAEAYVERFHRLPSPIMSGPLSGQTKWFFYPGFTPATGGLLRETGLMARRAAFDAPAWLAAAGFARSTGHPAREPVLLRTAGAGRRAARSQPGPHPQPVAGHPWAGAGGGGPGSARCTDAPPAAPGPDRL